MTLETTTISGRPSAELPLSGAERVPMDQGDATVKATTQDIADLAGAAIEEAIEAHEEAANPHPSYLTEEEADAIYATISDARFEQTLLTVRNATGTTIPKRTVVSFAGTLGTSGKLLVKPCVADGSEPPYVLLGVTSESIANNAEGRVLTWGKIFEVNTSGFTEGQILWANSATPGGLTATEPQAPSLKLPIAVVVAVGSANGILMVRATPGQRLQDLHDVEANGSKNNDDALRWNSTANRWEAKEIVVPTEPEDVGADPAGTAAAAITAHEAAADPHPGYLTAAEGNAAYATATQGAKADTAVQPGDPALSDAREWSAATIEQAEAEAGTATTRRAFTAQRVFQAIAAWWAASSAKTKLDGIATNATANATDAQLRDRSTHTGTQAAGTITGLAAVATSGAYGDLSGQPTIPAPADAAPQPLAAAAAIGTSADYAREDHVHQRDSDVIVIPVGDETTALTAGTNRVRFRMPFAATLLAVRASVNTAPTGSTLIVDINEAGISVLGTKLSIDATEFSSTTAASAATITDSSLADDAEISIDIDQIGSTVAGAGLKVTLSVRRA
jgi:hypothetical protein